MARPSRALSACLVLATVLAWSSASLAQSEPRRTRILPVDRIVAIVNSEVVTKSELEERMRIVVRQLRQQNVQLPPAELLERQVLERLINDRAQMQFAKDSGIRIEDAQIDRALERIAEGNRMTVSQFRRTLERDGVPFEKLREDLRAELTLQRLREREVDTKIQVSESEIDNFLADESSAPETVTEFNLSHILVRVPEGANSEALERLQAKARRALDELKSGADFAKVAVSYSDAQDGLQGGSMGWRTRERLPELFVEAVDRLKPGEVSEVMRSPAGFHILKLVERRGSKQDATDVEQTRVRHILVRANEAVSEAEARRRIDRLRQRIANEGASFEEIARFNSEDASAARGGELGWVVPGDTVPEFEGAMKQLRDNQLSEPVRTPFGWHLIQVLERRRGDIGADRKRLEARRVLRERKADEAYEEWLRQLRDRAYVEYRLEER